MENQEMTMRDDDVKRIGDFIKPWLRELVSQMIPRPATTGIDQQLLERMVRVEEELKAQRELMDERFRMVDRRFESVDKRFESVDKRFDDMHESLKRTQWLIGLGFVLVTAVVTVFGVLA